MSSQHSAQIIEDYVQFLWRDKDVERAARLFEYPYWAHDTPIAWQQLGDPTTSEKRVDDKALKTRLLSTADMARNATQFEIVHLLQDGEFVCIAWDVTVHADAAHAEKAKQLGYDVDARGGYQTKGIEFFRVKDGKIVEGWHATGPCYQGDWGETQTGEIRPVDEPYGERRTRIRDYVNGMWNKQDSSVIEEYLNDPCWRHDAGEPDRQFMSFDHAFQKQRAEEGYAVGKMKFIELESLECGEFFVQVWDVIYKASDQSMLRRLRDMGSVFDTDNETILAKGIEIFRMRDGRIIEVWVAQGFQSRGLWGARQS